MNRRIRPGRGVPHVLLITGLLANVCGCGGLTAMTEAQLDRGCVVVLPGVEGDTWHLGGVRSGLRDAGLEQGIEMIPWDTLPFQPLQNLMDLPANLKRADKIAARLTELYHERPDRPLTLVGFSGGGGLAILAVEALPKDVMLDRLILVAAAISNEYQLRKVHPHCQDKIINLYSNRDNVVGVGTRLFGTIDRKKTLSAGHTGFLDGEGRLRKHEKLVQIAWDPSWVEYGHLGGHVGYLLRPWARHVLASQIAASPTHVQGTR